MNRIVAKIELDNGMCFSLEECNLPLFIGRDSACGICVPQGHVSRRHCEIYLHDSNLHLRDISSNGTRVGQKNVRGNTVRIYGRTDIKFANDVFITITPCEMEPNTHDRRDNSDRCLSDRRVADRRKLTERIDSERRSEGGRRNTDRRSLARR